MIDCEKCTNENKCILHCEKDSWFDLIDGKKDWAKSEEKIRKFWFEIRKYISNTLKSNEYKFALALPFHRQVKLWQAVGLPVSGRQLATNIITVSQTYLKPLYERLTQLMQGENVIQMDETSVGTSFSRWAIVAFIEAHNVEALSREETHKFYKEG